jgi:hypothetical protein
MKTLLVSSLTLLSAISAAAQPAVIDYRFDEVKRKVTLASQKQQKPAVVGLKAQSGDTVETGWFSYALIATEMHKAKFEIFSSTKVALATVDGEPGVLLSLERGKLHAIFDKIIGNEPRVVKTPGALLAVRGTQYTVEVDNDGNTKVDVHEGIVEIRSPLRPEPFLVHAGELANYGRQRPPQVKPSPTPHNKPSNEGKPHGGEGSDTPRRPSGGNDGGHPPSHGGHGSPGSMPPPSQQPPPPPMKPPVGS